MQHDYKKVTQLIGWMLLVIVFCFSVNLLVLSGGRPLNNPSVALAAASGVENDLDLQQEKARLVELISGLLLCGRWPVVISGLSDNRGNPFEPKEIISQPLFFGSFPDSIIEQVNDNCLTVREVLNK